MGKLTVEELDRIISMYEIASNGSVRPDTKNGTNTGDGDRVVRDAKDNKPFMRGLEDVFIKNFEGTIKPENRDGYQSR